MRTPPLLAALLLLLAPPNVGGIPAPQDGVLDADLTKVATDRLGAEMKNVLAQLDRDSTRPVAVRNELKRKISKLKVAVYTTPRTLDEVVAAYERQIANATFLFGDRDLFIDLAELSRTVGCSLDPQASTVWSGKRGRSARWSREDGMVEIDIEDHLIDPRDCKITKRTVVMISSVAN